MRRFLLLWTTLATGLPAGNGGPAGVVVEGSDKGLAAERAGIQAGDVLVRWSREATSHLPAASGSLESPFDVTLVDMGQGPLGPVVLEGSRGGVPTRWTLAPIPFGLTTRPGLPENLLIPYEQGLDLIRSNEVEEGTMRWLAAATEATPPGQRLLGTWLRARAGRALADARRWPLADEAYALPCERRHFRCVGEEGAAPGVAHGAQDAARPGGQGSREEHLEDTDFSLLEAGEHGNRANEGIGVQVAGHLQRPHELLGQAEIDNRRVAPTVSVPQTLQRAPLRCQGGLGEMGSDLVAHAGVIPRRAGDLHPDPVCRSHDLERNARGARGQPEQELLGRLGADLGVRWQRDPSLYRAVREILDRRGLDIQIHGRDGAGWLGSRQPTAERIRQPA